MVKIENNNKYNINDEVWWFDAWGTLRHGTVYETGVTEPIGKRPAVEYVKVYENGRKGSCMGTERENAWPTKQACLEAEQKRSAAQVEEYKASIKDVNDLVAFLFENNVTTEDRDTDARKAAAARAKELLGLEIKY